MAAPGTVPPISEWRVADVDRVNYVPPPTDRRVATGVSDFDSLSGGVPVGSVVLLLGEAGAGHQEFALTSATHIMFYRDDPSLARFFQGLPRANFVRPNDICYISLTRSREQVLREVEGAFHTAYFEVLDRHLKFWDLSSAYFADSVVPAQWASAPASLLGGGSRPVGGDGGGPLGALARAFEEGGPGNVVIVDSLTDLLARKGVPTEDLLTLVKGLRRRAKSWDGVVYLLLSHGVASSDTEQALIDSVDGVLSFSWNANPQRSSRQRVMAIPKFMPVLAHVRPEHQGRFVIRVSPVSGLVTTQYERV
jgi:KaiC/GvpD/RAD55 family RecA-like ATPase